MMVSFEPQRRSSDHDWRGALNTLNRLDRLQGQLQSFPYGRKEGAGSESLLVVISKSMVHASLHPI
jgi:hypothetical protein